MESYERYRHYVNAAIGTFCAELATIPICTIKTNFQVYNTVSSVEAIRNIYNRGGLLSFFSASKYAITSQILTTTFKYGFYRKIQEYRSTEKKDLFNNSVNGFITGNIATILTHPLEVNKVLIQQGIKFRDEFKRVGPRLFVRGYSKGALKTSIGSSVFYPMYDFFNKSGFNPTVSGFVTSIISTTIMHPVDYLKVRHMSGVKLYGENFNFKTAYRGYSFNLFRIVPHFTITMVIIDRLNS